MNLVVIDSLSFLFYDQVGTLVGGMSHEICEDIKHFISLPVVVDGCSVDREGECLFPGKGEPLFSPGLQGSHLIDLSLHGWLNFPK